MEIQKNLAFRVEEYEQRLQRVRATMDERGLDGLLVHTPENICYLSGYHTPGYYMYQALIVPRRKEPIIITRLLEATNLDSSSWLTNRSTYGDSQDPVLHTAHVLADLGLDAGRLAFEQSGWFLSIDRYLRLKSVLVKAELVDGSGIVEKERAVKSPAEIAYIRRAVAITASGMQAVTESCRADVSERTVAAEIYKSMVEAGGEYTSLPVFISSGHRTGLAHATWSDKSLERGDNVLVELAGTVMRYSGPLFRTFSVGPPSGTLERTADVVVDMLEAVLDAIKPGTTSHQVDAAARRAAANVGLENGVKKRAGYSVGLNFPPDWGEGHFLDLKEGDQTVLEPGMVFHVPQSIRLEGYPPVAMSETVLVTVDGHEVLTEFPRKLVIV